MHACQLNTQILLKPFPWPDNLSFWQCDSVQLSEISIISRTIICLCTAVKAAKTNPNVLIDVWSIAGLNAPCSFCQNYSCHLLSEDVPLKIAVILLPQVWFVSSISFISLLSSPLWDNSICSKDMCYIYCGAQGKACQHPGYCNKAVNSCIYWLKKNQISIPLWLHWGCCHGRWIWD